MEPIYYYLIGDVRKEFTLNTALGAKIYQQKLKKFN